jgi:hypothetical protein
MQAFFILTAIVLIVAVVLLFVMGPSVVAKKPLIETIVTIVGSALTFIGLIFAGLQIRSGAQQLEAAAIYTMQKDARELVEKSRQNPAFVDYVLEYDPAKAYSDETKKAAGRQIGIVVQFYSSIFNQHKFGVTSREAWQVALDDMCRFIATEPVRIVWTEKLAAKYPEDFRAEANRCLS